MYRYNIAMKRFSFLLILFFFLWACQKDYSINTTPYIYIPNQFGSIIKINALNDFNKSAKSNPIFNTIYIKDTKQASKVLNNLNPKASVYFAYNKNNYLILTKVNTNLLVLDSIPNQTSKSITDTEIKETKIDSTTFYHKTIDSIFVSSNNLELLKTLAPQDNTEFNKLIETTDNSTIASLIFKSYSGEYSKLLLSNFEIKEEKSNYTVLDINLKNNTLQYNGIGTASDSIYNSLDSFKNTIPQKINVVSVTPSSTKSLTSITFDDYSIFNKNHNKLFQQEADSTETFLNFVNEVAKIENTIILHTLDPQLALEAIESKNSTETFRDIEIYKFEKPDFFKSRLKPYISFENAAFFSKFKEFLIFSDSAASLKLILTDALNENTLINSDAYNAVNEELSDEASLFIFKNAEGLSEVLSTNQKGYNANAVQFIYEDNYAHINGIIQKHKKKVARNAVTENFNVKLKTPILSKPQILKNHITKGNDIAIQDTNNTLYLISNAGNILWKKQLKTKIVGKISQIDILKNGRLQLVFNTSNKLYVLDRNGKEVGPFPIQFNDAITQPVSVFDYEKNRKYRILITQGKTLLMYDTKGKTVSGFEYKNTESDINTQPKHFRVGRKDYIAFTAGNTLEILNRRGQTRIPVKNKLRFSENELYLYKNKFTTSNTLGQLIQVDTKGKVSTTNLNLNDKHNIETTSKTLVTLSENKLKIKSRTVDLDYGEYTRPNIYYLNDKIYVTVTDLQAKKVYLFDSQAKLIPNFPVYGTSEAVLTKLDNDKALELVTLSDDKTILVYEIN